jgi:hypothetical protein
MTPLVTNDVLRRSGPPQVEVAPRWEWSLTEVVPYGGGSPHGSGPLRRWSSRRSLLRGKWSLREWSLAGESPTRVVRHGSGLLRKWCLPEWSSLEWSSLEWSPRKRSLHGSGSSRRSLLSSHGGGPLRRWSSRRSHLHWKWSPAEVVLTQVAHRREVVPREWSPCGEWLPRKCSPHESRPSRGGPPADVALDGSGSSTEWLLTRVVPPESGPSTGVVHPRERSLHEKWSPGTWCPYTGAPKAKA